MKPYSLIFTFLVISSAALAIELGPVAIGGTGCFGTQKVMTLDEAEGSYALPLRVRLNKNTNAVIDRKSCQVRIPVKLDANKKLQISDLSQSVRLLLNEGASAKSNLEVSVIGQRAEPLKLEASALEGSRSIFEVLKRPGLVAESKCGQDTIITGNLNIIASGEAKSFSSTGSLILKLKIVDCE